MTHRGMSHQELLLLLLPPPTDDRLFIDWSSIDSPRERMSQHDDSARNAKPNINQPDNQTEQPGSEPVRSETRGNTLGDVVTLSSTCQQSSQEGTRPIDREAMRSDIEVRIQSGEPRIDNVSSNGVLMSNDRDNQIPTSHSGLSSHETEIIGGSPIRTFTRNMIPQLDGPTSVCTRRRTLKNVRAEQEII